MFSLYLEPLILVTISSYSFYSQVWHSLVYCLFHGFCILFNGFFIYNIGNMGDLEETPDTIFEFYKKSKGSRSISTEQL
ncbi:unnamed protein product [Moneuplotes crassus]|uniref:Uncharacterized protein n=1 Tax=Euplotes crassus TaxID=5936 RepID=A0AAD1XYZ0_EUPCR|nr:unnamed protein product [Moneuplotes crassus]